MQQVFPDAEHQPATGAWRISSAGLGRPLEEDISIHPEGVWDFGEEVPQSPIDLVITHGGKADALAAARWLCERLGVDPTILGWRNGIDESGLAHLEARIGPATSENTEPFRAGPEPQSPRGNGRDPEAEPPSDNPKVDPGGGGGGALPPPPRISTPARSSLSPNLHPVSWSPSISPPWTS